MLWNKKLFVSQVLNTPVIFVIMIGSLANEWILGVKMKDERLKVEKQLSLAKVMDRLERSVSIENGLYNKLD